MVTLDYVPNGKLEILAHYGNPDTDGDFAVDEAWKRENLRVFRLPFPLRLSWNEDVLIRRVTAHKLVGDAICDALDEIGQYKGGQYLERNQLNLYGGIFNPRLKRGYNSLSTHTWAIAVDLNPHRGPLGQQPDMPEFIVEAFEKRGFVWGGRWSRPDGMHFQAARGY
jgi:hypothetical protein